MTGLHAGLLQVWIRPRVGFSAIPKDALENRAAAQLHPCSHRDLCIPIGRALEVSRGSLAQNELNPWWGLSSPGSVVRWVVRPLCRPGPGLRVRVTPSATKKTPCKARGLKSGAKRTRTADPLHAMQVLYQLSYGPIRRGATKGLPCEWLSGISSLGPLGPVRLGRAYTAAVPPPGAQAGQRLTCGRDSGPGACVFSIR